MRKQKVLAMALAFAMLFTMVAGASSTYTVEKGDALWKIAAAHGTSWKQLAEINNLKNPNSLKVGQVLTLTGATSTVALPDNNYAWDKEVEVLVVGAGVAGLSTAVELADLGAKSVLLVEKMGFVGGSAFMSDGIVGGYETQVTKKQGVHITAKQCFDQQMEDKKFKIDPKLTWITTEKSGETIDWLINTVKMPFQPEAIVKTGYGILPICHIVEGAGAGMRAPFDAALKARPNIELMLETPATELIADSQGRVLGAIMKTKDGKELRVKAKATILTTGGYSSNQELFARLYPANAVCQGGMLPWATGDGFIMASALGAGSMNNELIQCYLREYELKTGYTNNMYNIYVGKEGTRFMDEKRVAQTYNLENHDAVVAQMYKDGTDYYWAVADEATLDQFKLTGDAQDRAGVSKGDTLEALAAKIGVNPTGLTTTVKNWNEMVANGKDIEFGRTSMMLPIAKGPYYAVKCSLAPTLVHGGLLRNEKAEVTKVTGKNIPGLYAAGEVTAAANANGFTISHCITWGRIAAKNALEYAKTIG